MLIIKCFHHYFSLLPLQLFADQFSYGVAMTATSPLSYAGRKGPDLNFTALPTISFFGRRGSIRFSTASGDLNEFQKFRGACIR